MFSDAEDDFFNNVASPHYAFGKEEVSSTQLQQILDFGLQEENTDHQSYGQCLEANLQRLNYKNDLTMSSLYQFIQESLSFVNNPMEKISLLLNHVGGQSLRILCEYFISIFLNCKLAPMLTKTKENVIRDFFTSLKNYDDNTMIEESVNSVIEQSHLDNMVSGKSVVLQYSSSNVNDNNNNQTFTYDGDPLAYLKSQLYPNETVVRSKDTRGLAHRYIPPKLFSSIPAYNRSTYCDIKGRKAVKSPPDVLGWLDTKNHSFLIQKGIDNSDLVGKRLTINKLTDAQFVFFAMQVASGRGNYFPDPTIPMDPAFENLIQIVKHEKSTTQALHGPSNLDNAQQRELLFSYIRLHILKEDIKLHQEIQKYWLFAGSYVTFTKFSGWTQNPDEGIYSLNLKTSSKQ